jgi:multiple sugar transport system permease protein
VTAPAVRSAAERPPAHSPQPPQQQRPWTRDRIERSVLRTLRWVTIAVFMVATLFPFYYMVLLSLRPIEDLILNPGSLGLGELTASTYREVLKPVSQGGQGFVRFLVNSAIVAAISMLVALAVSIPGAYSLARLSFPGRRRISALFLAVYLFPAIVLAVPLYVLFTRIGLRGSLAGLVLVYISQTVTVAVYMLRNYFEAVPASIEEAALLDGLTRFGVLRRITFPLAAPSVMATGLFVFMIAWNEYLFALLFLVDRRNRWTVSLGLSQLAGGVEVPTTVLMAGSIVITVPIVVLYLLSERLLTPAFTAPQ